jgi:hypothetical protein
MKGHDNEDFTIKKIEDVSLLTPVKLHVRTPTKKRKGGNLLKRLQLDDVLFEDDEDELKSKKRRLKNDEDDDDDDDYPVISDEAKLQKVSTQSTSTIEAFYRNITPHLWLMMHLLPLTKVSERNVRSSLLKASRSGTGRVIEIIKNN